MAKTDLVPSFAQIAACQDGDNISRVFGLDANGRVWYYSWDSHRWIKLATVKVNG